MNKRKWTARAAALSLSATVLVGMSAEGAAAAGKDCTPVGRPNGPITTALEPLIGSPYDFPGTQPLGTLPFVITGLLDQLICQLTP